MFDCCESFLLLDLSKSQKRSSLHSEQLFFITTTSQFLSRCLNGLAKQKLKAEVKNNFIDRGSGMTKLEERRTRDRKVAGSNPGRSGGRIFFPIVNFVC